MAEIEGDGRDAYVHHQAPTRKRAPPEVTRLATPATVAISPLPCPSSHQPHPRIPTPASSTPVRFSWADACDEEEEEEEFVPDSLPPPPLVPCRLDSLTSSMQPDLVGRGSYGHPDGFCRLVLLARLPMDSPASRAALRPRAHPPPIHSSAACHVPARAARPDGDSSHHEEGWQLVRRPHWWRRRNQGAPQLASTKGKEERRAALLKRMRGRCFRCLSQRHKASGCREPQHCWKCHSPGHLESACLAVPVSPPPCPRSSRPHDHFRILVVLARISPGPVHLLEHFMVGSHLGKAKLGGVGFGPTDGTVIRHGARLSPEGAVYGLKLREASSIQIILRLKQNTTRFLGVRLANEELDGEKHIQCC
ncbi:hypothetical protein BRADI_4g12817v3 [Brachypodium distachyon]|uniref:CCHC-type domain-containing protein n=1 Tax=Brachypodium distachyon TaxID=15368 RepID=A0A2K2CME6_BRADI|nr:hypothetical protein BRADI_4g12817v3 [Brachypodium distachyon]